MVSQQKNINLRNIALPAYLFLPLNYSDLQSKRNGRQQWSDRWQLSISYKKCNVLYQRIRPQADLVWGDNTTAPVDSVRDLGVYIDSRLKFDVYI